MECSKEHNHSVPDNFPELQVSSEIHQYPDLSVLHFGPVMLG
jgi:hypothetical protein